MPLIKSVKQSAVHQNTEELIQSGRDPKQAYAIAKDVQRRAMKNLLHLLRKQVNILVYTRADLGLLLVYLQWRSYVYTYGSNSRLPMLVDRFRYRLNSKSLVLYKD